MTWCRKLNCKLFVLKIYELNYINNKFVISFFIILNINNSTGVTTETYTVQRRNSITNCIPFTCDGCTSIYFKASMHYFMSCRLISSYILSKEKSALK